MSHTPTVENQEDGSVVLTVSKEELHFIAICVCGAVSLRSLERGMMELLADALDEATGGEQGNLFTLYDWDARPIKIVRKQ